MCRRTKRDRGVTLVELLVTVMVIGAIATVLSTALVVTMRQHGSTAARVDVARWEQNLAAWLPGDLSSASDVSDDPASAPCGSAACTFGSNALTLTWDDGTGTTTVSYRYGPSADGESFVLTRVECHASCTSIVVLRDLSGPTDDLGNPIPWSPGNAVPSNVIDVTIPLVVDETDPGGDGDATSRAHRVIVNVNSAPGEGGVQQGSTVSFTAGGVSRSALPPAHFDGPTFLQANTGCGGPVTLIVDESGSIGSADALVRDGVTSFINTFAGTPTQLQIITFSDESDTLGSNQWNYFYDLSEPGDVADALDDVDDDIDSYGGTNWEDALRRAFFSQNGTSYAALGNPAAPLPELVVFFTDGEPTFYRDGDGDHQSGTSNPAPSSVPSKYNHDTAGTPGEHYGSDFSPKGWYRADWLVDQFRDVRMIGVGIGPSFNQGTRVRRSGWPSVAIPHQVFLGDLVAGNDPSTYGSGSSGDFVKREWSAATGWGDVSAADLLTTTNWNAFGSALTSIALAECGGTLTVQTRDGDGDPANANITYQLGEEIVTTTRIQKAGTFEVPLEGVAFRDVELYPQASFDGTGYTPQSWSCRAGGTNLQLGTHYWALGASAGAGIRVRVRADQAVACTLRVSP